MTCQTTTEQFPVTNRWTGDVLFTAEISVTPDMEPSRKLGLAVGWAVANNTSLREADLFCADLTGLNMRGADMSGANMRGANMRYADMRGADMRGANMCFADMRGADLSGAKMCQACTRNADMRGCLI